MHRATRALGSADAAERLEGLLQLGELVTPPPQDGGSGDGASGSSGALDGVMAAAAEIAAQRGAVRQIAGMLHPLELHELEAVMVVGRGAGGGAGARWRVERSGYLLLATLAALPESHHELIEDAQFVPLLCGALAQGLADAESSSSAAGGGGGAPPPELACEKLSILCSAAANLSHGAPHTRKGRPAQPRRSPAPACVP
jgi:hypothetical protein